MTPPVPPPRTLRGRVIDANDGAPITGAEVWDAGTEVNDEVPENTAALAQG